VIVFYCAQASQAGEGRPSLLGHFRAGRPRDKQYDFGTQIMSIYLIKNIYFGDCYFFIIRSSRSSCGGNGLHLNGLLS
jgi:hypothetical protein